MPTTSPGEVGLLILLAATLTGLFVLQGFAVAGDSMEPELISGQRVLVTRFTYSHSGPRRGDIVIFHYPRDPRQIYVKRVIGLPGESVAIRAGRVVINGRDLAEPYRVLGARGDMAATRVLPHQYFVLGDNRDVSEDSRYWGELPDRLIIGRAVACYWPMPRWRAFH